MKMKKMLALTMAVTVTIATVGCGSNSSKVGTAEDNTSSDAKVLTFLTADDSAEGGALQMMANKYGEEKGVEIKFTEVPYDDMETKMLNMIKAGNAPGVVRYAGYANFVDYTLDLADVGVSADDMYLTTEVDGSIKALAANVTANGLFINKTLFDQAGVSYPTSEDDIWTWDEFNTALQEVVSNSDAEYGMVMDHSQQRFATMLYQYGGGIFSEDLTQCTIKNAANVTATNKFLEMFENGLMPKSTWAGTEDPSAMFKTGKVAAHFSGNWKLSDYSENITDFEWLPVYMPYETQRATMFGGNYIYALDGSGCEELSVDFLKWFYQPENYAEYCKAGSYLPGRSGVEVEYDVEGLDVFNAELAASPSSVKTYEAVGIKYPGVTWGNVLRDSLDEAIAGGKTTEEVLQDTQDTILETYPEMTAAE